MIPKRALVGGFPDKVGGVDAELRQPELSQEWRAELLNPEGWEQILDDYAGTTKLAVALTDAEGRLLGICHNPQPIWLMAQYATQEIVAGCPFCLASTEPCTAVADAIQTGEVITVQDQAGLAHVAVPLSLNGRGLGALIAGQVFGRYPEPLPIQRLARHYGLSSQKLWHVATRQVPTSSRNLQLYAKLLMSLGNAHLGQRHAAILQRDLTATNLRYRLMIDGAENYALYTVDRAGRIISWNCGAERLFGYSKAEILGNDSACLYSPEEAQLGLIQQSTLEADQTERSEFEGWRLRKDGTRFYVTGLLAALGEGDAREYARLVGDITAVRASEEALRQAQKLESIGVLAGGIAHDFNNLLTGIMGGLSYAKDSLPPDHPVYPMVELAEESSERAAELTAQLLAYAGIGKFVITRFDLSALISKMLPLIATSIPRQVHSQLSLLPDLPWIEADASQIRQVVMNLIINGAEAIGEGGGTVRISTGVQDFPSANVTIAGDDGKPGTHVFMQVSDSGAGMSDAVKAKIFDPFFTTKVAGRGLGLAAVSGIIRGHKGRMDVQSVEGKGTTFTVYFPAVEPAVVTAIASPPPVVGHGVGTILIADDEPALTVLAKLVLGRSGYSVLVANNGREAVDIFKQNESIIALVLLDMTMPVMGGKEALHLIREIRPDVPIILSSGYTEDIAREGLDANIIAGFLMKPYSHAKLIAQIQASLAAFKKS